MVEYNKATNWEERQRCTGREGKFGRFLPTDKRYLEWKKVIPKPGLKIGYPICGRHFDVDDIVKGREIGETFQPFEIWKLKDLAVPKYSTSASAKKRNLFADCNTEKQKVKLGKSSMAVQGVCTIGKSFSATSDRSDCSYRSWLLPNASVANGPC
ncbi:hypothetical protein OUZ56_025332 [Daphnia magna]|uniref:THAP-type domain-containing protein n=1 Tax=Daphnia magna TaxID=35525 RepID=A0ABQ9ZJJ5_9CRUS|nr:hypothetical protein OUZ56_025332 [Daphnia magna]